MKLNHQNLVCTGKRSLEWQPCEPRNPAAGEVLVDCEHGAEKHGTMQAFYQGYANERGAWDSENRLHRKEGVLWNYPIRLGNMAVGRIVKTGPEVKHLKAGDRVTFFHPFQPTATVKEEACFLLRPETPWQSAVCLDPAEFAMGAIRDGHVRVGDRVAVSGLGAIGLMAVRIAKLAGASLVIGIDPLSSRREIARKLGADVVIDPTEDGIDTGLAVREHTRMMGVDVHVDFSGNVHALQAALRGVAYGGTIVAGAFPPPHATGLDLGGEAHMNRPHIVFSRACSEPLPDHPRWTERRILEQLIDWINSGIIDGRDILAPVVPFSALLEEYPKIATHPENHLKLGVSYT